MKIFRSDSTYDLWPTSYGQVTLFVASSKYLRVWWNFWKLCWKCWHLFEVNGVVDMENPMTEGRYYLGFLFVDKIWETGKHVDEGVFMWGALFFLEVAPNYGKRYG